MLVKLLHFCHATVEHANQLWHAGLFTDEDCETVTCQAVQFGFKRLIPLLLGSTGGGWHELLAYVEHPERFPWYDPETDWPCSPPLMEFRPEEDEIEITAVDPEEETETEQVSFVAYPTKIPS